VRPLRPLRSDMKRIPRFPLVPAALIAFVLVLFCGCTTRARTEAPSPETIEVTGVVEGVCVECDIADIVGGGNLAWDVLTVRLTSPQASANRQLKVEVRVEGDGVAQRSAYSLSSTIRLQTTAAALNSDRLMLDASEIRQTQPIGR